MAPSKNMKKSIRSKLLVINIPVITKNTTIILETKNFFLFFVSESIGTQSSVEAHPMKNTLAKA